MANCYWFSHGYTIDINLMFIINTLPPPQFWKEKKTCVIYWICGVWSDLCKYLWCQRFSSSLYKRGRERFPIVRSFSRGGGGVYNVNYLRIWWFIDGKLTSEPSFKNVILMSDYSVLLKYNNGILPLLIWKNFPKLNLCY